MRRSSHLSLASSALREATESDDADRRTNIRHTISELPWLNGVRLKYGPTVTILDLSRCGAQIETHGFRLQPGSRVVLEISTGGPAVAVAAQVLRCQLASLSPHPIYRGAVVFKETLDFPDQGRREDVNATDDNPVHEHARLSLALKRWSDGARSGRKGYGLLVAVDAEALAAALSMMDTPQARLAGRQFAREVSRLFRTLSEGLDQQATQEALLRRLTDQVRRTVPARTIRLIEGKPAHSEAKTAPIYVDVPSDTESSAARMLVDVAPGSALEEWHFQYLKAAAHLIAVVRKLTRPIESTLVDQSKAAPPSDLPAGWHKVVVRYADGRLLKGHSREFTVSSTALEVWPAPDAPPSSRITVPLGYLKAVFFVRDFDGDPDHVDSGVLEGGHGRLIAVTFLDGETLMGTTLNYSQDAIGFFIRPTDSGSNNTRVFVAARAIRHVQFPTTFAATVHPSARRSDAAPTAVAISG